VTEPDPYFVLGVPRSASRDEIARAYRTLAKQHHPDAGAPASPQMSRINEAWHVLSDGVRRARWDRHHTPVEPMHWAPVPTEAVRRPIAEPAAPPSRMDSGWLAAGVVAIVVALVAVVMLVVSALPASDAAEPAGIGFDAGELTFRHPDGWQVAPGDDAGDPRILAHLATFAVDPESMCTRLDRECAVTGDSIPAGNASILISAWAAGTPPVVDPVIRRPYGLDVARIIGDAPAAFRFTGGTDAAVAWWQLSPPGFPDRWIEVHAELSGGRLEQETLLNEIDAFLQTVEFTDR
jgi:hypothetical protein